EQVCTSWQAFINCTSFWFRKMHQLGIEINPNLKTKLMGSNVDHSDTLILIRTACLYAEEPSSLHLDRERNQYHAFSDRWLIMEEDLLTTSVFLLTGTSPPDSITLNLGNDPESIRNLDIFLLVISCRPEGNKCDIDIKDMYGWRNLRKSSNQWMELLNHKRCMVDELHTAVDTIDILPYTLQKLRMGLVLDSASGVVRDPGFARLNQRCPFLDDLSVHVKAGMVTHYLPRLPIVMEGYGESGIYPNLYLSQLSDDCHLSWAVETARTLQPLSKGYSHIILPSCGLSLEKLCELLDQLARAGVTVQISFLVSSQHSEQEFHQLYAATRRILRCTLRWAQNDDTLGGW
ncbi:unnamed protein product, partial [Meganyctiphanes norvegica]